MPLFDNNPTSSRKPTNRTQRLASSVRQPDTAQTHRGVLVIVALLFGCLTACSDTSVTPDLMVETREGPVLGKAEDGVKHWLGLPFAAPPIGELRFKAPQPAKPWGELLETTEHRPACVQKSGFFLTDINKGRFHTRKHTTDLAFINISDNALLSIALDQHFFQRTIFGDRHSALLRSNVH